MSWRRAGSHLGLRTTGSCEVNCNGIRRQAWTRLESQALVPLDGVRCWSQPWSMEKEGCVGRRPGGWGRGVFMEESFGSLKK